MYPVPVRLVVHPQVLQTCPRTLVPGSNCERLLLLRKLTLHKHRTQGKNVNLGGVLHFDGSGEEVVESFSGRIGGNVGDSNFACQRGDIDDCTFVLSFEHVGDDIVTHQNHWNAIDVDFIEQSFVREFVEVANIGYPYIVDEDGGLTSNSLNFELFEDLGEEPFCLAFGKISSNRISSDEFVLLSKFF